MGECGLKYVIANLVFGENEEDDKYVLQYAPPLEEHVCQQTGHAE